MISCADCIIHGNLTYSQFPKFSQAKDRHIFQLLKWDDLGEESPPVYLVLVKRCQMNTENSVSD